MQTAVTIVGSHGHVGTSSGGCICMVAAFLSYCPRLLEIKLRVHQPDAIFRHMLLTHKVMSSGSAGGQWKLDSDGGRPPGSCDREP
jgi:hypothetical protein